MRKYQKKTHVKNKFEEILFNTFVGLQSQFFETKIQPNQQNLILIKLLTLIVSLQEIQLISRTTTQSNQSLELFLEKYSLNFIYFNNNTSMLVILSITELCFTIMCITNYFYKKNDLLNNTHDYSLIIHHTIINLPIINITFNFILQDQLLPIAISMLLLNIFHQFLFCFFNVQKRLIEIEGCFSHGFQSILQFFGQMLLCYLHQKNINSIVLSFILLFYKLAYTLRNIHNYHKNSSFVLTLNTFMITYIVTLLGKQTFCVAVLIFLPVYYLQQLIRLRNVQNEFNDNKQLVNLFKYTFFHSGEIKKNFKRSLEFQASSQFFLIQQYEKQVIQSGQLKEKLLIIDHIFKERSVKLYLNLIRIPTDSLSFSERVDLQVIIQSSLEPSKQQIQNPLNLNIFIQSLELEQENQKILLDLISAKTVFYKFLMKEMPYQQFLIFFERELNKILQSLAAAQDTFEKQYNLEEGRLSQFSKSDQVSLDLIKTYYSVFYSNNFKVQYLENKQSELLSYNRIMNEKILQNQVMMISISYMQDKYTILNKDNKRLFQMIGNLDKRNKIHDLFPEFQNAIYNDLIDQFVNSEFKGKQPYKIFLEHNQYLKEYELYIHPEISTHDIILHHFLIAKNDDQQLLIFDTKGKILGIGKEIFDKLKKKSEDLFDNQLSVEQFLESGMIQYYIPDIYNHLYELCSAFEQESLQNQIIIRSKWIFPENHKTCLEQTFTLTTIVEELQNNQRIEAPTIGNIKLSLMQEDFMNKIQCYLVQSPNLKQQEFFGILKLIEMKFSEHHIYFELKFTEMPNLVQNQKQLEGHCPSENHQELKEFTIVQSLMNPQYEGILQQHYEFQENMIRNTHMYTPLIIVIAITFLMILLSIIALVVCYQSNYQSTIYYQEQINFLQAPQAMTFCYTEHFLINWNRLCAENNLYELSPFIQHQMQVWFPVVVTFFNGIRYTDTRSLSERSEGLGFSEIELQTYTTSLKKNLDKMNIFEFYTITQEALVRQYLNLLDSNTDYSIFMSNGIMRQNIVTILNYHDIVLNALLKETQDSFSGLSNQNFMILLYITLVLVLMLITLTEVNCKILRSCERIVKLLRFLDQQMIFEHLENLEQQRELISSLFSKDYIEARPTQKNSENFIQQAKTKVQTLRKIEHYKERYLIAVILSVIIGCQLVIFIFHFWFLNSSINL